MLVQYYPSGKVKARMHLEKGKRGGDKGEMFWRLNAKNQ
jgi:antitoxin component YwqK of YwqJK toxin-antitoxin module